MGMDFIGFSRRMLLLWRKEISLTILSINTRWIDISIKGLAGEANWTCVFLYGELNQLSRDNFWASFMEFVSSISGLVVCMWDWNSL